VLIPVWSTAPRSDRVPASVSSKAVIWLSGIASVALGIYPTTLLLIGDLGSTPFAGK
jgi:hypothetical protein